MRTALMLRSSRLARGPIARRSARGWANAVQTTELSSYESLIPGSQLLFENARTAVLSLNPEPRTERRLSSADALHGTDHLLLTWGGGGSEIFGGRKPRPLTEGAAATWNPFGPGCAGVGLRLGSADSLGMLEATLVIVKPESGAGDGPLGGWPPLIEPPSPDAFAYVADSLDDAPRPRPWTVTTDIAQQVLLENDLVRIWRFELAGHEACHAHQHVYPYFFLNLRDAHTRRLEWSGGEAPAAPELMPSAHSNTAPAGKLFWLDTLEGGRRSTHWHGLENLSSEAFRQFIVEFKQASAAAGPVEGPELRRAPTTLRDPTLVYLPGLHGGASQFIECAREMSWAAPNADATEEVRAHPSVETAAAALLARHPAPSASAASNARGGIADASASEELVLCGHSYGGMVALAAARLWLDGRAPAGVLLRGLVLMSTSASAQTESVRAVMDQRRQRALAAGLRAEVDASWPLMVHPSTDPPLASRIQAERVANAEAAGADAFLRQLDSLDARPCQHDTLRRLAQAGVPVLIIHGQDDALVPVSEAEAAFATLSSAHHLAAAPELVILEGTGHFALQERQPEVAHTISTWWRRVCSERATILEAAAQ